MRYCSKIHSLITSNYIEYARIVSLNCDLTSYFLLVVYGYKEGALKSSNTYGMMKLTVAGASSENEL